MVSPSPSRGGAAGAQELLGSLTIGLNAGFLSLTDQKRGFFYRLYENNKTNQPSISKVLILFVISAVNTLQEYTGFCGGCQELIISHY